MDFIKRIYRSSLEFVGEAPSLRQDWRWLALYTVVVYALVLALRLSFAGRWDHPELWVNGERIMSTHDAYFWLAKAKGVGVLNGYPMAQFIRWMHDCLGFGYGAIGFWMPAFMGALVGVVCLLWGWLLGGRNAGIFAGLAGALSPGFFYRSRLGYLDTDMFTLVAPLLVTWMLAFWCSGYLRRGWFAGKEREGEGGTASLWLALGFGLVARIAGMPHQDIVQFNVLSVFFAVAVVLAGARSGQRVKAIYGLTVFCLAAFPGTSYGTLNLWPISFLDLSSLGLQRSTVDSFMGIALAACLALACQRGGRYKRLLNNPYLCAGIFVTVLVSTEMFLYPITGSWEKLLEYFFPTQQLVDAKETLGPIYPSIVQSIIETKLVPLSRILERGAFFPWLGYMALFGGLIVVALRPASVFLLPLVLLHLSSVKMGIRFSMFGGASFMIFLGVVLYWLSRRLFGGLPRREAWATGVQGVLGGAILVYCLNVYGALPLTPVIPKAHAEALIELGKTAPKDAMIWTWWDWGYSSQYYAGLETVVDGGKHSGRDVYPVGFVMTTPSPEKANRMVAFSAQCLTPGKADMGLSPAIVWDKTPRDQLSTVLEEELSKIDYPTTPPQYLVVSWKDMRIVKWISYFGNWNLQTGETSEAASGNYNPGELGINFQRGAVMNRTGGGGLVKDITVLDWSGSQSQSYFMNSMAPQLLPKRQHLIVNKVTRQSVLMDRIGYRSVLRMLLTEDPKDPEISKYFKIVVDKLPFARIYEVVQ